MSELYVGNCYSICWERRGGRKKGMEIYHCNNSFLKDYVGETYVGDYKGKQ